VAHVRSRTLSEVTTAAVVALAALAGACDKPKPPPPEEKTAPTPVATATGTPKERAQSIYTTRCALCHGQNGRGDGPSSAMLQPRPRDYTDKTWQKVVDDDQIRRIIVKGGAAVGKSAAMPESPDLVDKPDVVTELVLIIRGFGGAGAK